MPLMIFFVLATLFVLVFFWKKNGLATLHSYKNCKTNPTHVNSQFCVPFVLTDIVRMQ